MQFVNELIKARWWKAVINVTLLMSIYLTHMYIILNCHPFISTNRTVDAYFELLGFT
jgi:hypothetical protein